MGKGNIVIHSRKTGRYQCKQCRKTFTATQGTPFYRLHHSLELMTCVVTLIAHGCPVQAIVAAFALDERTVMAWQARAGQHAQQVHEHLVEQPRDLEHVQADEIKVKVQGQAVWLAMALMVRTRLWLGAAVSLKRDEALLHRLFRRVRASALARPLLVVTDGLSAYFQVIREAFRSGLPQGRGRPPLREWPNICIGKVAKQYQGRRVVGIARRILQGSPELVAHLIATSQGGLGLNTAYIERLNGTFRNRLASLARRSRALLRKPETLTPLVYWMVSVYNFCSEHQSLRVKLWVGAHGAYRWVPRTPAMAAGITDHCWTVKELLWYRVPIPAWKPSHRGRPTLEELALQAKWAS